MEPTKRPMLRNASDRQRQSGFVLFLTVFLSVFIALGLPAGGNQEESSTHHEDDHDDDHIEAVDLADGERLHVVATTSIVGDVVSNVAGDAADVTILMPIGQNPHAWEPTPAAMAAVETAHIVFVNGLGLEESLIEAIDQRDSGFVVEVSNGIDILNAATEHDENEHDDHDHAMGDPHTWFSPLNVKVWVENIKDALASADPGRADEFVQNASAYTTSLESLDEEMRNLFEPIPSGARKLVIDHASLGYFARDYGFEILGAVIPSTTDQAEPSAQAMSQLVRTIEAENVSAIFVGGTASQGLQNLVATVAQEIDREIAIYTLLTGSLTPPGTPGDTYLGFIRHNAQQITQGFAE